MSEVRCLPGFLAEIGDLALSGYRRYSWGGVETGGILFGRRETGGVIVICAYKPASCEHQFGPSFELSERDTEDFERLLASCAADPDFAGLVPIGWYQSISSRSLGLSDASRTMFDRFFPERWQLALVLKRSKAEPLSVGIILRDLRGGAALYCPPGDYTLDGLRQEVEPRAAPAQAAPVPAAGPAPEAEPDPVPEICFDVLLAEPQSEPYPNPAAFFGLQGDPFSGIPDPRFFYPSPQHREALAILFHRVRSRAGFLSLIGPPGTGKSIVIECLTQKLKAEGIPCAYLLNSKINVAEFFELLAHDLRLSCSRHTKTAVLIALNEHLLEQSQAGRTTALLVDSAQKLPVDVLEEIELLGNLENRDGRLLQIVFAAQPAFERHLDAPPLRGLKQRMLLQARLTPFDQIQMGAYIQHRLAVMGRATQDIFSEPVLAAIHGRTGGVPRLINTVCSGLLATCFETGQPNATVSMVDRVARELALDEKTAAPVRS